VNREAAVGRGSWVRLAVVAAAIALPASASAQVPTIQTTVTPSTVSLGDTLVLEVRVIMAGGNIEDVELPDLSSFDVLSRHVSRPMSFSFGTGQAPMIQSSTIHTLTLQPRRAGTVQLSPVRVRANGQLFQGQAAVVNVVHGTAPPAPLTPIQPGVPALPPAPLTPLDPLATPAPAEAPPGLTGAQYDPELFVRTTLDRERAYIGQQVTMTVFVYSRVGVRDLDVVREPSTEGFWTEDLIGPVRRLDFTSQDVGGQRFDVAVLRKVALFPMRAGTLTISPPEIEADTRGGIFSGGRQLRRAGIPGVLEVLPLPAEGQPPGFDPSNVGRYELEASLDRDRLAGGDAATLKVRVHGEGNLRQLRLPQLTSNSDLRILPPQVRDRIVMQNDRVSGERTWEWFLTPLREGRIAAPPVQLAFFDPEAASYRTVAAPALFLTVAGAPPVATGDDLRTPAGPAVRSIRNASDLRRASAPVARSVWYALALATPPGFWLGLTIGRVVVDRRRRSAGDRPRRALGDARRRLKDATKTAKAGDAAGAFSAVARLLQSYLEDRIGERLGHETMEALRTKLAGRGYGADLAERVVKELENCDFARFTPAAIQGREIEQCLDRTGELLDDLERVTPAVLS